MVSISKRGKYITSVMVRIVVSISKVLLASLCKCETRWIFFSDIQKWHFFAKVQQLFLSETGTTQHKTIIWKKIKKIRLYELNPYSPMMEFFYKILLSEEVFNKMNIFGFIFEKKINIGPKIQKYIFVSLNWR